MYWTTWIEGFWGTPPPMIVTSITIKFQVPWSRSQHDWMKVKFCPPIIHFIFSIFPPNMYSTLKKIESSLIRGLPQSCSRGNISSNSVYSILESKSSSHSHSWLGQGFCMKNKKYPYSSFHPLESLSSSLFGASIEWGIIRFFGIRWTSSLQLSLKSKQNASHKPSAFPAQGVSVPLQI